MLKPLFLRSNSVFFMFHVKPMAKGDFRFATDLANTMGWNMAPEDFQFNLNLDPGGCLVAFNGRERVGVATCISFGKVGWFGNLIVKEKYRGKGAGRLLVKHALKYLQGKGAQTVGLYAYRDLHRFYGSLGFEVEQEFTVFEVESLGAFEQKKLRVIGMLDIGEVERFDASYFGADRKRLLESIILEKGNLGYVWREGNVVEGYVAATVYERMAWVGPMICREGRGDVAIELLRAALPNLSGKSVYTVLPKKETALANLLLSAGFKEGFSVSRMFFGEAVAKNCIYLAESLERG